MSAGLNLYGPPFDQAVVANSKNQRPTGMAGRLPAKTAFGDGRPAGKNAIYLLAPEDKLDWTRIWFKPVNLPPAQTLFLSFSVGHLLKLPQDEAYVSVVASANSPFSDKIESKELKNFIVKRGNTDKLLIPLGLWPLKKNFSLRLRVGKTLVSKSRVGIVFDEMKFVAGRARPESGMQRAGLAREKQSSPFGNFVVRDRVFRNLRPLKSKWFRTGWTGRSDDDIKDVIKRAKGMQQKVLLTLMPSVLDYDSSDPYVPGLICSAKGILPLSTINHAKYRLRLQAFIRKIKAEGLSIEAFEVGNEFDYFCFNGDAPSGADRSFTNEDEVKWAQAYALFLQSSAKVIRQELPAAQVITFGIANIPDWFGPLRGFHLSNPARTLALLKDLEIEGTRSNYFNYADGIGVHIYPHPNTDKIEDRNGNSILMSDVKELKDLTKPFWITEWGYRQTSFSEAGKTNKFGETRQDLFLEFLSMLNEQVDFELGPVFLYAMESPLEKGVAKDGVEKEVYTLVDETLPFDDPNYWLPEAFVFQRLYAW